MRRLIFLMLPLLASVAGAQTISAISDTVAHADTVWVTGYDFGNKGNPRPLLWAPFDTDENPSDLGYITEWGTLADMTWDADDGPGETGCLVGDPGDGSWTGDVVVTGWSWNDYGRKAYLFRKVKRNFDLDFETPGTYINWKAWRAYSNGGGGGSRDVSSYYALNTNNWTAENVQINKIAYGNESVMRYPKDVWVTNELWYTANSSGTASRSLQGDGTGEVWYDGEFAIGFPHQGWEGPRYLKLRDTDSYDMNQFYAIHGQKANVELPDSFIFWTDDVYVDSTYARVMLGDGSTFTTCTKREIQIPIYWASDGDSIQIIINEGELSDDVYMYVVDPYGSVSPGVGVTIGGEGGSYNPPIASPGQPSVVRDGNTATLTTTNSVPAASLYQFETQYRDEDTSVPYTGPSILVTEHPDTAGTRAVRGEQGWETIVQAVDSDGNSQSSSATTYNYTLDASAPTATVADATADTTSQGVSDRITLKFTLKGDEDVYQRVGYKRTADSDTMWYVYADTLVEADSTMQWAIELADTPDDAISYIAFGQVKDASQNTSDPDTALIEIVREEPPPAAVPSWTGKLVYAMTGWTGDSNAGLSDIPDTSDQDYRIRNGMQWFAIQMADSTDKTPPSWGYSAGAWFWTDDGNDIDFSLSAYGTGSNYWDAYPFFNWGSTDSIAGATVDSAKFLIPYGGTFLNPDTVLVAGVSNMFDDYFANVDTSNVANYRWMDTRDETLWPNHPSLVTRGNIGEVVAVPFVSHAESWVIDVTDAVQHCLDNSDYLVLMCGAAGAQYEDFARLYYPTQSTRQVACPGSLVVLFAVGAWS
jgi:hypothetical protein